MRILILNYEFPPLGGGAGSGSFNLARELVNAGCEVDVLTSRAPGQLSQETICGIRVYRVYSWRKGIHDAGFRGAMTYVASATPRFLRLTAERKYDVVHYFFSLPTGVLSLLPGSHRGVPYVVSLRGSDVPGYDPYNTSLQAFHGFLKPVTRKIWRDAHQVVALSGGLKSMALETDSSVDFAVVPNGVDTDVFWQAERTSSESFRLVTVSRLVERKGIQHVLQALAELKLPDIHLTVVGEGQYETALRETCDSLGLQGQVTFYGYCPREALPELFAEQDLFILPSIAEAFGQAFVEAMSCGMPVIGGKVGGVTDIVGPENGILVEPQSVEQIKSAIMTFYHDRVRCRTVGDGNRARVLKYFSWQSVAQQYLEFYQHFYLAAEHVA